MSYDGNNELAFAQAGVSFASDSTGTGMVAEDIDGDGLADLVVDRGPFSVEMMLGGVDSASVGIEMLEGDDMSLTLGVWWWDRIGDNVYPGGELNGDGSLNFFDVSAFLTAFGQQDPVADFTGDGAFNFFDVSAFLTAFSAGCP